jgi:hypothetical protein
LLSSSSQSVGSESGSSIPGGDVVTVSKKLKGFIPYRIILWPDDATLKELAEHVPATQAVRVEGTNADLENGRYVVEHHLSLTLTIDLRRPLDELFKEMITNARIRVRKAEKLGDRISVRRYSGGPDPEGIVDEFIELYNSFVDGKRGQAFAVSKELVDSFFPHADLILMCLDGKSIGGHFNLIDRDSGISRMILSGSRRFEDSATARLAGILNVYLHWWEISKYREEGMRTYDFGGIGGVGDNVGVNRFKLQFGRTIVREHNYLLAGMPGVWRTAFKAFTVLSPRGQRRRQLERAGDRWKQMPVERIREVIQTSVQDFEESHNTVPAER